MPDGDPFIDVDQAEWAEWQEAKLELSRAKHVYAELSELFKKRSRDFGTSPVEIRVNGTVVGVIHHGVSERFDSTKFKAQHADIWHQFLTTSDTTRIVPAKGVE